MNCDNHSVLGCTATAWCFWKSASLNSGMSEEISGCMSEKATFQFTSHWTFFYKTSILSRVSEGKGRHEHLVCPSLSYVGMDLYKHILTHTKWYIYERALYTMLYMQLLSMYRNIQRQKYVFIYIWIGHDFMLYVYTTKTCCNDVITTTQITFVTSLNSVQGASAKLNGQNHLPL